MNELKSVCFGAVLSTLLLAGGAHAQEQQPLPVEIWGCEFVDGAGMNDLVPVHNAFNQWADQNGITELSLSTMTNMFTSPEDDYDVLYVGAWGSGAALGDGYTKFYSDSFADVAAAFDQVVDCDLHAYFVGNQVVPWSEERGGGPVQFQDCTVLENVSDADAIASIADFAGSVSGPSLGGFAVLFPFIGESRDASYDFKLVAVFDSYQSMGNAFDYLFRQGGIEAGNDTLARTMQCDQARMYSQAPVREMAAQ
jgi:hypothetical protein